MTDVSHDEIVAIKEAVAELSLEDTCLLILALAERLGHLGLKSKFEKIQTIMMEVEL